MELFRSREGEMKEEVISSGGPLDPLVLGRSSSPPPTPGASSAGASSPSVPVNIGAADWFTLGQASKAGSLSCVGSHPPRNSLSTNAGGSALGSSQPSCRPWDRGDLLRRLATFNPSNWSGKPKVASPLACARRGWVNVDVDRIVCESCGTNLSFVLLSSWTPSESDSASEAFAKQLDIAHRHSCPWKGNICAESLVQFPPTPPSALIGGYKDRCDGLFQFVSLPIVAASATSQMRISRSLQIDRLLAQSDVLVSGGFSQDDAFFTYSHAQKLISLCGWETRWQLNLQDCEEHSAQSARDGCSVGPNFNGVWPGANKNAAIMASARKDTGKRKLPFPESRCESRSPMLDCTLCGASVRIWDFLTVPRPARLAPNNIDTPEVSKKMELTRGVSAASGISGWVAADGLEKEQLDEVKSVDLNLSMAGVLESPQENTGLLSEQFRDASMGRDLRIGQPSGSEIGDRAASFESRGPSSRKRNIEGGGSTIDRPQLQMQQADSVEGTVIDRDGDEVDDGGPSKRYRKDSSGAGPSHSFGFRMDIDVNRSALGFSSARASSVIAMDTVGHNGDDDSMDSVENYPGDLNDVHFPSPTTQSNQAQQSTCFQDRELVVSSINDGEEILNTETGTINARERFSFGVSGGSVGMGASHEAEIHGIGIGIDLSVEAEVVAEVTENEGEFVPEEDPHGDSHDVMLSRSVAESVDNSAHPSHSCNAVVYSGYEVSKEEVTQTRRGGGGGSVNESVYGIGPPNGESNYDEPTEFDPIKCHNRFCPWVNGNVGGESGSSSSGWQMTLDALDAFQSLENGPIQTMPSESAASLCKDEQLNSSKKNLSHDNK